MSVGDHLKWLGMSRVSRCCQSCFRTFAASLGRWPLRGARSGVSCLHFTMNHLSSAVLLTVTAALRDLLRDLRRREDLLAQAATRTDPVAVCRHRGGRGNGRRGVESLYRVYRRVVTLGLHFALRTKKVHSGVAMASRMTRTDPGRSPGRRAVL